MTGGVSTELDNEGDDRERGQIDTYSVPNADSGVFALQAAGDDGWKIDSITYGGLPVDMASCNGGSVWMDNPCVAPGYGSTPTPCMTELTIDTTSMTVTNCPHMMTATTATDKDANSDGGINYISGSDGSVTDLDIFDFNNREKGQTDTYFIPLVSESFQLEATGTDGWSFDALSYDGSSVDMSSCPHGKLWLDKPCTKSMYGDYACLESVTVNVEARRERMPGDRRLLVRATGRGCPSLRNALLRARPVADSMQRAEADPHFAHTTAADPRGHPLPEVHRVSHVRCLLWWLQPRLEHDVHRCGRQRVFLGRRDPGHPQPERGEHLRLHGAGQRRADDVVDAEHGGDGRLVRRRHHGQRRHDGHEQLPRRRAVA